MRPVSIVANFIKHGREKVSEKNFLQFFGANSSKTQQSLVLVIDKQSHKKVEEND